MSHLLAVKPQFLCFYNVSAVAVVLHIFFALLQIPAVSVVLCTSYRELEKKKRCFSEAMGGFLQPALGCDLVCVCGGGNLIAVVAILFALGISCLLCPSICQRFAPYIFSTVEHSAGCQA